MRRHHASKHCAGIVLLAMLVFILVTSLAASSLVRSAQQEARRAKEAELLFVGDQFRRAILSYYNSVPPGGARSLPPSLDALLEDRRFPMPVHHLRRSYPDPMTASGDWEPVFKNGGIAGIHSRSTEKPLKKATFPRGYEAFENAGTYADWIFLVTP
jgi:type II secretory pathway pseudopilin PulG